MKLGQNIKFQTKRRVTWFKMCTVQLIKFFCVQHLPPSPKIKIEKGKKQNNRANNAQENIILNQSNYLNYHLQPKKITAIFYKNHTLFFPQNFFGNLP